MNKFANFEHDVDIDHLIRDYDETYMSLPDIEYEPHLLISKVRKHYMEYMIKLLKKNYETNQRLVNKNIYIPSAIWKCAKKLEMKAAQTCMVVQLYRKCIVTMINEVKNDTKQGRLYNKLYESLHLEPKNEKRTQTRITGDDCQCQCNEKKRRRKKSSSPKSNYALKQDQPQKDSLTAKIDAISLLLQENNNLNNCIQRIPVIKNMQIDQTVKLPPPAITQPQCQTINPSIPKPKDTESDDIMLQLEALFQGDNDDDLFTSTVIESSYKPQILNTTQDSSVGTTQDMIGVISSTQDFVILNTQGSIIEDQAAQIKSLDARLSSLTGLLVNVESNVVQQQKVKPKKSNQVSKWLCEEYFLKKNLFDLLYQIGDSNRLKLARIKQLYLELFGGDSDDEGAAVSPAEGAALVASCKARIDGWVRASLAPALARGHLHKQMYKPVARHLIELIYKCKQYPSRHEVMSFVMDFLENRGKIRCEADFKEFRIDNVNVAPSYTVF